MSTIEPTDPYTLRVKGGDNPTDPTGLSLSIIHVLSQNQNAFVNLESVGPKALVSVMTAFRLAAEIIQRRTDATVLVLRQSEYTATVSGQRTQGLRTRIFAIPIKYAI